MIELLVKISKKILRKVFGKRFVMHKNYIYPELKRVPLKEVLDQSSTWKTIKRREVHRFL